MADAPRIGTTSAAAEAAKQGYTLRDTYPDPNAPTGPDEETVRTTLARLAPRHGSPVGNLADLQRAGALIAEGRSSNFEDGVMEPPGGVDHDAIEKSSELLNEVTDHVLDVLGLDKDANPAPREANVPQLDDKPAPKKAAAKKD